MAITIKDVAVRAKVSVGTVSRVLNDDPSVSPARRQAVLHAIDDLGYRPNRSARNLRHGRTGTVGLLVPDFGLASMFLAIAGVDAVIHAAGLELLVASSQMDPATELERAEAMLASQVDGLMYFPVSAGSLVGVRAAASGVPVVRMTNTVEPTDEPTVLADPRSAFREAAAELFDLGHRRVAHLADGSLGPTTRSRRLAFESVAAVLPRPGLVVREAPVDRAEDAPARLAELLRNGADAPTAIVMTGERLAAAVVGAVGQLGLRVPRHLSLIHFGMAVWGSVTTPPLASVGVGPGELGRATAKLLLQLIEGGEPPEYPVVVHGEYIRGGSVGPVPKDPMRFFD